MDRALNNIRRFVRRFWGGLREWCGDAAYERYLRASGAQRLGCARLNEKEFYLQQLERRWSRPNRCC
jgi:Selenoprotein, putative